MGLYLRKGLNFGLLRLNLSRSGLGVSLGVKGARIGVGPRGAYVHAGRGGLYFRQSIPLSRPANVAPVRQESSRGTEIESAGTLVGLPPDKLIQDLIHVRARHELLPVAFVCAGITVGISLLLPLGTYAWCVLLAISLPFLVYARHVDVTRGTLLLHLNLSGDVGKAYEAFTESFRRFASCDAVWYVDNKEATDAWKTHAGATQLISRHRTRPTLSAPPRVVSNVEVPTLSAARQTLYFFPDRLVVYDRLGITALSYRDLMIEIGESQFRETESVPADAQIAGSTWQYVNRSGGPDRRFRNNRQVPIARYGVVGFAKEPGLTAIFQCSNAATLAPLVEALKRLSASHAERPHPEAWRLVISRPLKPDEFAVRALLTQFRPELTPNQIDAMLAGERIEVTGLSAAQANNLMAHLDRIGIPSAKYENS